MASLTRIIPWDIWYLLMTTLKGKTVVIGITGGIAAYKTCELVRELAKAGADVHVIVTEAAQNFVTPLTLQTLSNNPVHTDMFALIHPEAKSWKYEAGEKNTKHDPRITIHISLADRADVLAIAPASANVIAKVAHGICDDLLTTTICATKARVVFAPSMNVNMWENPITQGNIKHLRDLKYQFIDPEEGELACGYKGVGRMADISKIVEFIKKTCSKS